MKQLSISVLVDLPADLFEEARLTFQLSEPWLAMRQALDAAGIKYEAKLDKFETRAKPRGRKPRIVEQAA